MRGSWRAALGGARKGPVLPVTEKKGKPPPIGVGWETTANDHTSLGTRAKASREIEADDSLIQESSRSSPSAGGRPYLAEVLTPKGSELQKGLEVRVGSTQLVISLDLDIFGPSLMQDVLTPMLLDSGLSKLFRVQCNGLHVQHRGPVEQVSENTTNTSEVCLGVAEDLKDSYSPSWDLPTKEKISTTTHGGNDGCFSPNKVFALYDFDPSFIDWPFEQAPLPLVAGQAIEVVSDDGGVESEWSFGHLCSDASTLGYFPKNYTGTHEQYNAIQAHRQRKQRHEQKIDRVRLPSAQSGTIDTTGSSKTTQQVATAVSLDCPDALRQSALALPREQMPVPTARSSREGQVAVETSCIIDMSLPQKGAVQPDRGIRRNSALIRNRSFMSDAQHGEMPKLEDSLPSFIALHSDEMVKATSRPKSFLEDCSHSLAPPRVNEDLFLPVGSGFLGVPPHLPVNPPAASVSLRTRSVPVSSAVPS